MDEDIPDPIPEKSRYLLPDGCKDLMDLIRLQESQGDVKAMHGTASTPGSFDIFQSFFPDPTPGSARVALPDPVAIQDLATALHLRPFEVIATLMAFNVFASVNQRIDFGTAAALCAHYGVTARKVP
jgi:hypothetical protein